MLNKTFTLESETGLHARPATELAWDWTYKSIKE